MGVGVGWGVERCDKLDGGLGPLNLEVSACRRMDPKTGYKEVWGGNDI